MKRQMTTSKKPVKKGFGGVLKNIKKAVKSVSPISSVKNVKAVAPVAQEAAKASPVLQGLGSQKFKSGIGSALKKLKGRLGLKKGGSVMADKMGRAMKKKTSDSRGRAMRGR